MTDRDTFAAAALTGILSRGGWVSSECAAEAYLHADAMLRERGVTEPMPEEKRAEVSVALTDAEREAIRAAEDGYFAWMDDNSEGYSKERLAVSDTLRKLLERLQ